MGVLVEPLSQSGPGAGGVGEFQGMMEEAWRPVELHGSSGHRGRERRR